MENVFRTSEASFYTVALKVFVIIFWPNYVPISDLGKPTHLPKNWISFFICIIHRVQEKKLFWNFALYAEIRTPRVFWRSKQFVLRIKPYFQFFALLKNKPKLIWSLMTNFHIFINTIYEKNALGVLTFVMWSKISVYIIIVYSDSLSSLTYLINDSLIFKML